MKNKLELDHETSKVPVASGTVIGGLDRTWTGAWEIERPISAVTEIPADQWPVFCAWCTEKFRGIEISLEEQGNGESSVDARGRPLEEVIFHALENSVPAITIVAQGKPKKIRLNVTGPQRLRLHRNPAGWPIRLEIERGEGRVVVHFTGKINEKRGLSSNAWGE